MMLSIYEQMKQGAPPPGDPGRYRFSPPAQTQTDPNRFRIAPPGGGQQAPAAPAQPVPLRVGGAQAPQAGYQTLGGSGQQAGVPRGVIPNTRNADGDRPYPYAPQKAANGAVEHWRPPTWQEILKEMGWRMLESGIQAIAYEVAYFFGHRRLGVPTYVQHP